MGTDTFDSSAKRRVPSWTDRILFKSKTPDAISCVAYTAVTALKTSDHRPVAGVYTVSLPAAQRRAGTPETVTDAITAARGTMQAARAFRRLTSAASMRSLSDSSAADATATAPPRAPADGDGAADTTVRVAREGPPAGPALRDSSSNEDTDPADDTDAADSAATHSTTASARGSESSASGGRAGDLDGHRVIRPAPASIRAGAPQSAVCIVL